MNSGENERTEMLYVRVLRQYNYMVRSFYVTLVLLIVTACIGVNYTNKQSQECVEPGVQHHDPLQFCVTV